MRYFFVVLCLFVAIPALGQTITGKPENVSDGDTFTLNGTNIRLFGMDTPEKKQLCAKGANENSCWKCGVEAGKALRSLIAGKTITCQLTGASTYDRKVAVCKVDGRNINVGMVWAGWAVPYWRFHSDLPELEDDFERAFTTAAANMKGIHRGKFVIPSDWRNKKKRLACEQR